MNKQEILNLSNSQTIIEPNIEKLRQLFPQVFCENKIDFSALQELLGENVLQNHEECYKLSWVGKQNAIRELSKSTTQTLTPMPDKSVDFEDTNNLLIEGENLEVLRVLQKSYFGKIKMIYIDPPYNTGNDFVYNDSFAENKTEYLKKIGKIDSEGKAIFDDAFQKNTTENGQYHSNWLSMIYSRLMLARELLRDDGVIFVSIDDHEQANLKLLMDNVFGEDNFVSIFVWKKTENIKMDSKFISNNKDYVLCYIKGGLPEFLKEHSDEKRYNLIDEKSKYYLRKLDSKSSSYSRSLDYIIEHDGIKYYAGGNYEDYLSRQKFGANKKDCIWLWSRNTFNKGLNENEIVFKNGNVYNKVRFDGIAKKPFVDLLNVQSGQSAQEDFNNLFDGKRIFDHPKPVDLVYQLITMVSDENEDDLILDFFAGSGTTAHAVMQLNAEDGGNRKFICVQLPEPTDQKSEAYKAGYKTISQITAERIKRAGTKIAKEREEKPKEIFETEEQKLDTGFKFYKLTNTHFKIWHTEIQPTEIETVLDIFQDATVDTNSEEMLYELMLKLGYELTTKIEKTSQNFYYIPGYESCFALDNFENETILEIAKRNPRAIYTLNNFFEKDAELSCLRLGF